MKNPERLCGKNFGITVTSDNSEVAAFSDILILAVKPQFYAEVIHEIREIVQPDTLVVSIAPGKTHQWLEETVRPPGEKPSGACQTPRP